MTPRTTAATSGDVWVNVCEKERRIIVQNPAVLPGGRQVGKFQRRWLKGFAPVLFSRSIVHLLYNTFYMALHIADPEVDQLVATLAQRENVSKTELLRRVLRRELAEQELHEKRRDFRGFAVKMLEKRRKKPVAPATKEEMDRFWGKA
jgi:hypothetical protein